MLTCVFAKLPLEDTRRNNITLVNNGYENILIPIGESVPVSQSEDIKRTIKVCKFSIYIDVLNW